MKKFLINVNGTSYNVDVEEIREGVTSAPSAPSAAPAMAAAHKAAAPAAAAVAAPAPKAAAAVSEGSTKVVSPMPGTIMGINVKPGDTVKKGTVLLILEAMKMQNEIMAAGDGTVTSVLVVNGEVASTGQLLVVIN